MRLTRPPHSSYLLIHFLMSLVAAIGLSVGSASATDNEKTWYVNIAMPNDSGDGHSPGQAKKFLTSAASLSAEGDTIYIAPGVYTAANPKSGQHWIGSGWGTVLQKTTGGVGLGAAVNLSGRSSVTIENMKVQGTHPDSGQGILSSSCSACVLRRLWVDGPLDGGRLDGFHNGLIENCLATSDFDAWVISGRCTTVRNTMGITSGARSGNQMACFKSATSEDTTDIQVTYLNCQAYCLRSTSNAAGVSGWVVDGRCVSLLENCTALIMSTAPGEAGEMSGILARTNGVCMVSGNCVLRAENSGPGGAVDLKQTANAQLQVDTSTTRYNTTSGSISVRLPNEAPGTSGGVTIVP
jgi:hypothetical protein